MLLYNVSNYVFEEEEKKLLVHEMDSVVIK